MTQSRLIKIILTLLIIGYVAFFSAQLVLHYHSFGSRALDLGNIGQAIWNTSQGQWFHQTNQPGASNRLSLHVEPILIPVSWLYTIYPRPEILFVFQSTIVALGAVFVFALAKLKLKNEWLALVFALVYLMLPAIQGATLLDFHAVTLAPTFLLGAFYFLETKRTRYFALFAVLAVACKEDITLLVMMMGFYALIFKKQYTLGSVIVGLCLVWSYLAVFVIPPAFAGTENIHWNRYDHLGDSPLDIVANMVLQPQLFLQHLQDVDALNYGLLLLAPMAFTALLYPVTLLLAAPSLGINLLSSFPPMQRVNSLIYAAPVIPAVIISSIFGATILKRSLSRHGAKITQHSPLAAALIVGLLILATSLIYHIYYGFLPGGGQFRGWETVTDHHRLSERIFNQIPPDAKLSAQDRLNPHVSQRETLYIFDRIDDADHIVLDVTLDSWPLHPVALRHRVDEFLNSGFGVVDAVDGYLLLANNRPNLPATLPDSFYDFARVQNPETFSPQFPANVTFDDKLQLIGYSLHLGAHEKFLPVVTLYWRTLEPLDKDYNLWPFFINRNGEVIENPAERPLVSTIWYPTSQWSQDEIIATSTLPLDIAPNLGDEFTLTVGVANGDWNDPTQRLPISKTDPTLPTLENNTWARLATFSHAGRKQYPRLELPAPQPQQPLDTQFWDTLNLTGVDLPTGSLSPGDTLPFTLYWHSITPMTVDFTTFAHLLNSEGNVVAQLDWGPQDSLGYLPTSGWIPHQPVIDQQSLPLPTDLSPGEYRLIVGWYYAPTGERLPLTIGSESGDTVSVGVVVVE